MSKQFINDVVSVIALAGWIVGAFWVFAGAV